MTRPALFAANWKMHGSLAEAHHYAAELARLLAQTPVNHAEVVVCPPALYIREMVAQAKGFTIGAQDCHTAPSGAYTGEHSAAMFKDAGCGYVIVGHSERRQYQGETDALVCEKATAVLTAGLEPIICIGESLQQRQQAMTGDVLVRQLETSVPALTFEGNLTIAYEPVWAIGTGLTPTSDDLYAAHTLIHDTLRRRFGERAGGIRVLYGGSVKPENASEILGIAGVNGVLVGGASLKAESMAAIIGSHKG